jgi:adenine-specific DNA methylase
LSPGSIKTTNAANGGGQEFPENCVISTDPPYYDNVVYSDLSDFFYVWLRLALKDVWPDLFRRVLTPKEEELVANPYRQGGQVAAEAFFLEGMRRALRNIMAAANADFPVTAGVGPVDMAQSALGPGMGIFTSYAKVLEPDDSEMSVRTAIALINEAREEILGEEDSHYDSETRFCIDWFQAFGVAAGKSGDAIGMATAYNLGLSDLEQAGVFFAKGGIAKLVKRSDLPVDWHPSTDKHLTHWECAQHLIRILEAKDGGEASAARLIAAMNPEDAEAARTLAYRLYDICEKKGWAQEAQVYNLLAEEFPHLEEAALEYEGERGPAQASLDL